MASVTECRCVGIIKKAEQVNELANLLRSLCSNYCTHAVHEVVFRMPLSGGASTTVRLSRRLPANMVHNTSAPRAPHPLLEDPPERWEVRHEGPPLQGPALNALPAAMKEVTETACYGAGALAFWKVLGGRVEHETYREGNEYNIVFQGHQIKVVLLHIYSLHEQHVLRDASSVMRVGSGGLLVDVSCLVPEGKHYEGANILGAFGTQLAQYVELMRAEAPSGAAAARTAAAAGAAARRK